MKKLLIGLMVVILIGAAVSTLHRFTGINLESAYRVGAAMYVSYSILKEYDRKKRLHKINVHR